MKVDELQPIIKTILNLSPQEQFEVITILLRNILDIHKVDEIPQDQDDYKKRGFIKNPLSPIYLFF